MIIDANSVHLIYPWYNCCYYFQYGRFFKVEEGYRVIEAEEERPVAAWPVGVAFLGHTPLHLTMLHWWPRLVIGYHVTHWFIDAVSRMQRVISYYKYFRVSNISRILIIKQSKHQIWQDQGQDFNCRSAVSEVLIKQLWGAIFSLSLGKKYLPLVQRIDIFP